MFLLLWSVELFAQRFNGVVKDKLSGFPIQNATIITGSFTIYTSVTGKFSLSNTHIGDTVNITCIGYLPYYLVLNKISSDTVFINLDKNSILLKAVTISGKTGYKDDSLKRRKEFGSVFNYKSPTFKDIFIPKYANTYTPYSYNTTPNNTTSIISLNLLSAIGLVNKSNAPISKFQKTLIKDEEDSYIDHVFSKRKVSSITALKDDSLSEFMNRYRPSVKELRKMNDYDLILYIKNNYLQFKNKN